MNTKILFAILAIIGLVASASLQENTERDFTLHMDPDSATSGAKCQDGTTYGIYVQDGDSENVVIYFEGGGYCVGGTAQGTIDSCAARIGRGYRSTSKDWEQTMDRTAFFAEGILSGDSSKNPDFWRAKKIFVPYTDGAAFNGHLEAAQIATDGTEVWFRGYNNAKFAIDYMFSDLEMDTANEIILSGGSAGAMGVWIWMNYFKDQLTSSQTLLVVPDSGFFPIEALEQGGILPTWKSVTALAWSEDSSKVFPSECTFRNDADNVWKCGLPEHNNEFWNEDIPQFHLMSLYDAWSLTYFYALECMEGNPYDHLNLSKCDDDEDKDIERLGVITNEFIEQMTKDHPSSSFYSIACVKHVFLHNDMSFNSDNWESDGKTIGQALRAWGDKQGTQENKNKQVSALDDKLYPYNQGCNGQAAFDDDSSNIIIKFSAVFALLIVSLFA